MSIATDIVSVGANARDGREEVKGTGLALGHVAHKPWPNHDADAMLKGIEATWDHFQAVGEPVARGAKRCTYSSLAHRAIVSALHYALRME